LNIPSLDSQSVVPLYYQIQQRLLDQIRSGALKPGQLLPSEQAIAQQLGVSRMTGRQALKALCDMGVAYTVKGKGTFVSGIKLELDFRHVTSFTEEMRERGLHPESQVLSLEVIEPDQEAASALHLAPEDLVVSLRRLRFADNSPMGIEWSRIPHRLCPGFVDSFEPSASLYETLARRYGIRMAVADEIVEAGLAGDKDARLLQVPAKSPVFLFTRTSYVQSGKPIEFVKSVYPANRYKLVNRLTRLNRDLR
jgi:GntR family transcriptional regulator